MSTQENGSTAPDAAAHTDQQDADRLATEHGETDFAGFPDDGGDGAGGDGTAVEEAAEDELGDIPTATGDDRARPRTS